MKAGDYLVQSKILYEFIVDDILIDRNNQNEFGYMETPRAAIYSDCECLDGQTSDEAEIISTTISEQCSHKTPKIKTANVSSTLKCLRSLPNS